MSVIFIRISRWGETCGVAAGGTQWARGSRRFVVFSLLSFSSSWAWVAGGGRAPEAVGELQVSFFLAARRNLVVRLLALSGLFCCYSLHPLVISSLCLCSFRARCPLPACIGRVPCTRADLGSTGLKNLSATVRRLPADAAAALSVRGRRSGGRERGRRTRRQLKWGLC